MVDGWVDKKKICQEQLFIVEPSIRSQNYTNYL